MQIRNVRVESMYIPYVVDAVLTCLLQKIFSQEYSTLSLPPQTYPNTHAIQDLYIVVP
jgi:hypothetical protein